MSGVVNLALSSLFIGNGLSLNVGTLSIGVAANASLTTSGGSIALVNDLLAPGVNMVYGTNSMGTKGWVSASAGLGNVISVGTPTNGQIAQWTTATNIQGIGTSGSGNVVLVTGATLVTPALGVATATSVNGLVLTAASTGFTIAGGTTSKTLSVSNTLTLSGTDSSTLNIGGGGTLASGAFAAAYTLPTASTILLGGVKVDGTSITISGGVISTSGGSPAGSNTWVQYNNNGAFGANSGFTCDSIGDIGVSNVNVAPASGNPGVQLVHPSIGTTFSLAFTASPRGFIIFDNTGSGSFPFWVNTGVPSETLVLQASNVQVGLSTVSSSPTTGALIVSGGLGIGGNISVAGNLTISSGSVLQLGSTYVAGVVVSTGTITIKDATGTIYNVLVHT